MTTTKTTPSEPTGIKLTDWAEDCYCLWPDCECIVPSYAWSREKRTIYCKRFNKDA